MEVDERGASGSGWHVLLVFYYAQLQLARRQLLGEERMEEIEGKIIRERSCKDLGRRSEGIRGFEVSLEKKREAKRWQW